MTNSHHHPPQVGELTGNPQEIVGFLHLYQTKDRLRVVTSDSSEYKGRAPELVGTYAVHGDGQLRAVRRRSVSAAS